MAKKPTIGLTGGIASGKSTVARLLRDAGVAVVDADAIAREVVAPGEPGLAQIVATFGRDLLGPDGSLQRERLAARVFSDEDARKRLQAITHPLIGARSAQRIAEHHAGDALYVVYDAPLLVEVGAYKNFDALIVVAASEAQQVARAVARDGMLEADAKKRIAAQLALARKIEVADYVIHNDDTLAALENATHAVHARIMERFVLGGRAN